MKSLEAWLQSLNLEKYLETFEANSVDLDIIADLTEQDLADLGVSLGDRKRIKQATAKLARPDGMPAAHAQADRAEAADPTKNLPPSNAVELRQLTLMFVDLVGSTKLSNQLDLEQYHDVLAGFQRCCLTAIRNHFGYFAQFVGDGVVAYFGYPIAEEDDAERAVLAALDIQRTIADAAPDLDTRLQARVGIATGDVLIDDLPRDDKTADHLALGDIPNLAARLQSLAEPGQVAISDQTKIRLGANFSCTSIGQHQLKGFSEPVGVWIAKSARDTELRFEKRQHGKLSRLVGREDELRLLEGRWSNARQGSGHAVFLTGEAGLGKSRLAQALHDKLRATEAVRMSFQCSPYHQTSAFYPVTSHLNHAIKLREDDATDARNAKIDAFVATIADPVRAPLTQAIFANLLSEDTSGITAAMTPEELKEKTFETLIRYFERASATHPALVLFEDLHWIDPSTEELLGLLVDQLDRINLLLIGTYRPDYIRRWGGQSHVTTLSLARLDTRQCKSLVSELSQELQMAPELVQKIADRAEGVPLFVEEMVRMVQRRQRMTAQDDLIRNGLELPSNLKDLLRAKIDHLPSTRDIVFVCAALGREISTEVVSAICKTDRESTERHLDILVQAQILTAHDDGRSHSFRHALIQDAAYESMLPRRASNLHGQIADTLVQSFPAFAERSPEVVAQHYWRANVFDKARDKWREAAEIALRSYAGQEAMGHLEAAIEANTAADLGEEGERQEIELREMLSVALEIRSWGAPEIATNLDRLRILQMKTGTPSDVFLVLHGLCGTHLIGGRPDLAQDYCDQMNDLVGEDAPPAMLTLREHNTAVTSLFLGRFDKAIRHFDKALDYRQHAEIAQINRYYAADPATIDRVMRCWAGALNQNDRAALEVEIDTAIATAQSEPSDFSRCYSLSIIANIFQTLDDPERALQFAQAAYAISQKIKFEYWEAWCSIILGWALARTGEPTIGTETLKAGLKGYISTGSAQIITYAKTLLADAHLAAHQPETAEALIREVQTTLERSPIRFHVGLTEMIAQKVSHALNDQPSSQD
ncbi:AAA family ATPase [Roseobacter sp. YSTF-M11]|uniref:AAA family ATPase n=1 Tax=Roseobacter insulae TaxID=2859783 RepID=A0A9X1FYZ5_9RHOB|nr:AAA family ATPase [Roseobacter insulae]MBW4710193.1 AAA family ATPase [Roseobacter insulae]